MNILIIGGSGDAPSANSVCVKNMAQEFIRRGHNVWNLAEGDSYVRRYGNWDGITLTQVPADYHTRLARKVEKTSDMFLKAWFKIESFFRHLLILPLYPCTTISRSRTVLMRAKEIVLENDILIVVTIFNSYENIYAGIRLKQTMRKKIRVISYHLDLRTASLNSSSLIRSFVRFNATSSIVKESRVVDRMLIPYSGQKEMKKIKGLVADKVLYVGLPVYITEGEKEKCILPFEKDCINVIYIGTLSIDNRDPRPILNVIEKVSKKISKKIIVHFWGNAGGVVPVLDVSPVAVYHGTIDNKYVRYVMENADFLLNIGNSIAYDMLPSKTFGMFATGKPIINVVNHPMDATLPFFARYGHSIDLYLFDKYIDNTDILSEGIMRLEGIIKKNVDGLFDDFKPETICNLILGQDEE